MIQLYTNNTQDITKNGIILNVDYCKINPVLNTSNELELEINLNKNECYNLIKKGCCITVPTPEFNGDPQIYEIYDFKKIMSENVMIIYARHIFFSLGKKILFNKNIQGNGQQALNGILEGTKFKGMSNSNIVNLKQYKMRSIINVLNGNEEDSFTNIWGGEIECNNYNVNFPLQRGADRGIRVTFGYNLDDIEEEILGDEVVTRIYPYSGDLVLSGNTPYVDSPLISKYSDISEQNIEMSDIKVKERTYDSEGNETTSKDAEGFETRAEAEAEMIKRCKKLYDEGADKIKQNYKVRMKKLSKTNEYKKLGYDILEDIKLGDTVHCYNKNIGIEVSARCISYIYDVVNEEYIDIELGEFKNNYIDNKLNDLDNLYKKILLEKQYILLKVDSLNNTMYSEFKMTEDEIAAKVNKDDFGALIKVNYDQILLAVNDGRNGTDVILNTDGLEVHKGKFRIYDESGNQVFSVSQGGRIKCDNGITCGERFIYTILDQDGLGIFDEDGSSKITRNNKGGLNFSGTASNLTIGGDTLKSIISSQTDVSISNLDVNADLDMGWDGSSNSNGYEINSVFYIDGRKAYFTYIEANTKLTAHNAVIDNDLSVNGDLDVSGSKPCLQTTKNYGKRRITAYETAEYYFGDIGSGKIKNGECIVTLEDIFAECVNTDIEYQVFTQVYNGSIKNIKRFPNYFIINGENGTEFAWEIKAKRKGWENTRLEERPILNEEIEKVKENQPIFNI